MFVETLRWFPTFPPSQSTLHLLLGTSGCEYHVLFPSFDEWSWGCDALVTASMLQHRTIRTFSRWSLHGRRYTALLSAIFVRSSAVHHARRSRHPIVSLAHRLSLLSDFLPIPLFVWHRESWHQPFLSFSRSNLQTRRLFHQLCRVLQLFFYRPSFGCLHLGSNHDNVDYLVQCFGHCVYC